MKKEFRTIVYFILAAVLISFLSVLAWLFPRDKLFAGDNPFNRTDETVETVLETETDTVSDTEAAADTETERADELVTGGNVTMGEMESLA